VFIIMLLQLSLGITFVGDIDASYDVIRTALHTLTKVSFLKHYWCDLKHFMSVPVCLEQALLI